MECRGGNSVRRIRTRDMTGEPGVGGGTGDGMRWEGEESGSEEEWGGYRMKGTGGGVKGGKRW